MRMGFILDHGKMYADGQKLLDQLTIRIPSVRATVGQLSGGQRQAVAIARALAQKSRVVLLDEPTAALGVEQTATVGRQIVSLRDAGHAVVLISHDMQQVFEVSDNIFVLRRGQRAAFVRTDEVDREEVVGLITGAIPGEAADTTVITVVPGGD
jgi:ABC-type sugar transport system ATPase subunit